MQTEGSMETNEDKSKGILALEKLQNNGYRLWTVEEIKSYRIRDRPLSSLTKEILSFIGRKNSFQKILSSPYLKKRFRMSDNLSSLHTLERREMAFRLSRKRFQGKV